MPIGIAGYVSERQIPSRSLSSRTRSRATLQLGFALVFQPDAARRRRRPDRAPARTPTLTIVARWMRTKRRGSSCASSSASVKSMTCSRPPTTAKRQLVLREEVGDRARRRAPSSVRRRARRCARAVGPAPAAPPARAPARARPVPTRACQGARACRARARAAPARSASADSRPSSRRTPSSAYRSNAVVNTTGDVAAEPFEQLESGEARASGCRGTARRPASRASTRARLRDRSSTPTISTRPVAVEQPRQPLDRQPLVVDEIGAHRYMSGADSTGIALRPVGLVAGPVRRCRRRFGRRAVRPSTRSRRGRRTASPAARRAAPAHGRPADPPRRIPGHRPRP